MNDTIETKVQDKQIEQGRETETGQEKGQERAPEQGRAHFLDLKLPIGCLLSAYGAGLTVYGLVTKKEIYDKSLGLNVNLMWGVLMLVVGGLFLLTAFLKRGRASGSR